MITHVVLLIYLEKVKHMLSFEICMFDKVSTGTRILYYATPSKQNQTNAVFASRKKVLRASNLKRKPKVRGSIFGPNIEISFHERKVC